MPTNEESFRMMELSLQGFGCSQILVQLALEAQGAKSPELVRAMSGLLLGMGTGGPCGARTGGCCVLGLYAGRANPNGEVDGRLPCMLIEFSEWFEHQYVPLYGGTNCTDIIGDDERLRVTRCPHLIAETWDKLKQLLAENDIELTSHLELESPPA